MAAAIDFEAATTTQTAAAFGVTVEALAKWRSAILPEAGIWREIAGKGRAGKSIRWRLPRLIEWRAQRLAETLAAREAKALNPLEQEQLRKAKRENDEREGMLVSRPELEKQWAKVGADLRQRLEAIGRQHGTAVGNAIAKALAELQRSVHGLIGDKAP